MAVKAKRLCSAALWAALVGSLSAQAPAPVQPAAAAPQQTPTFRIQIDAVTMDVIVKDENGRFISDLTKDDFEVFEDGVKQDLASLTVVSGGRVSNVLGYAARGPGDPPPARE